MTSRLSQRVGDDKKTKTVLIGLVLFLATIFLILPLVTVFYQAFSEGVVRFLTSLSTPDALHAIGLTLLVTVLTIPVNLVFGVFFAWTVTRYEFIGRKLLLTLLDVPFAVSPVVAGLLYLLLYGSHGFLGAPLLEHDVHIMFAWPGILLVTIFVTCPFVARELIPLMQQQGRAQEEAAIILGASGWQMFRRVTLPNIKWALIYGVILTNARAIGEFGAVSVVSGNIRGQTNTLPLHVELSYQDYQSVAAFSAASLLGLMAIVTLFVKTWTQRQQQNKKNYTINSNNKI